jgi:GNAT superfamily N-acetyltransferase
VSILSRLSARLAAEGPRAGLTNLATDLSLRVVDRGREVVLLRVELTDPRNHLRPRDRAESLRVLPVDRVTLPRLVTMLERHAPAQTARVRSRFLEGMRGFVAEDTASGAILGYTFFTPGRDAPGGPVHRDLTWLGLDPAADEVYAFDYFLEPSARGRGATFVRAVQEAQASLGHRAALGYVYASNRPALWLYRTTGWREVGRIEEHRLLGRVALVEDTVYWMAAHGRTPVRRLPAPLARLARRALARPAPPEGP